MNIVVCIKQVPNTNEVKLDPVTGTLIREGVPSIINPDAKAGLEAALRLKDSMGAHVTVLSMGPPQAVSYTHLDVYKRQCRYRSGRAPLPPLWRKIQQLML